jgi:hypothetical protein
MESYGKCSICYTLFTECVACDNADILECGNKNCINLICDLCCNKYKYKFGKSFCFACYFSCHNCKKLGPTHVHVQCGYALCDECYHYNNIVYDDGRQIWEICAGCNKKIKVSDIIKHNIHKQNNKTFKRKNV